MTDRGFLIRDLLLERRAKLVIPPFTKKCNWGKGKRLLQNDNVNTKCIARLRIHVERAIERLKIFQFLSNTMPLTLKPLSNQKLTDTFGKEIDHLNVLKLLFLVQKCLNNVFFIELF